jgi:outer membrane receptor for ferrienterochelin and colicin
VFGEYTIEGSKLSAVIGMRADYHNIYKAYFTPRLHAKYQINKTNRINIQGGMARRSSYFIAENLPLLINGRTIILDSASLINNQWLPQEKAI